MDIEQTQPWYIQTQSNTISAMCEINTGCLGNMGSMSPYQPGAV
jgi:L-cysteine desulfidase